MPELYCWVTQAKPDSLNVSLSAWKNPSYAVVDYESYKESCQELVKEVGTSADNLLCKVQTK